jgi:RHS repeat-associated protein
VGSDSTFLHSGIKNADTQTDDGGDVSAMRRYDAFGNPVAAWGGWQGPFGYGGPYGYQTDNDHGLMLLGHRYYEADTGRFLTRVPIKDGQNWYGYCDGSPTRSVDADGLRLQLAGMDREEQRLVLGSILAIGGTAVGGPLVRELLDGQTLYIIEKVKSRFASRVDDETHTLLLNFDDVHLQYPGSRGTTYFWMTLPRVIAHELAHLVHHEGSSLGSDHEQTTVDLFENPIMAELGDDRTRGSYGKPFKRDGRRPPSEPAGPFLMPWEFRTGF